MPPQLKYLKTAFTIPLTGTISSDTRLLIEIGEDSVSLLWYQQKPFVVKGLSVHHFEAGQDTVAQLTSLLEGNQDIRSTIDTTVSYNVKELVLIPDAYFKENNAEAVVKLIFGEREGAAYHIESIPNQGLKLVYRIPAGIAKVVNACLPTATWQHSVSKEIGGSNFGTSLYCIVSTQYVKLILHKDDQLQIVQQFGYTVPEDVLYYLVHTCQQHGLDPANTPLRLCGMIDKDSPLYRLIYQYFAQTVFTETPPSAMEETEMKTFPAHYFSHLTALATCAS